MYLVKTPWLVKKLFPNYLWNMPISDDKTIYLTFDDGPHPLATTFVLDTLKQFNAKATFFCIGKNVVEHEDIYKRILSEGHSVGNHTHNHFNGFKTKDEDYIDNVIEARKYINSKFFRPPYGRIKSFQARLVEQLEMKVVMWSILSGDFDVKLSPQKCLENILLKTNDGDIVVFHDSEKAYEKLNYALPKLLEHFCNLGYTFKVLS